MNFWWDDRLKNLVIQNEPKRKKNIEERNNKKILELETKINRLKKEYDLLKEQENMARKYKKNRFYAWIDENDEVEI